MGCRVGGYRFAYGSEDAATELNGAIALAQQCALALPILWIDCEDSDGDPGPSPDWLDEAISACQAADVGVGIYSYEGWWNSGPMQGTTAFSSLPLWAAQPDEIANLSIFTPFGGWTTCAGKQYTSSPCDTSIFNTSIYTGAA